MTDLTPGVLRAGQLAAPPRTLLDILRETSARHPEASALDDGSGALSYRELMARVIRVAARLNLAGVRRGDRVGVRMQSGSRELYVSILGIMAAGAAYVPVDADDPEERAALVFGEAEVCGIISGDGVFVPTEAEPARVVPPVIEPTVTPTLNVVFSHTPEPLFAGHAPAPQYGLARNRRAAVGDG